MNKYIFHGGGSNQEKDSNHTFFSELVRDIPENGTLLLVYFASRTDDSNERRAGDIEKCKQATGKNINFEVATTENLIEQIKNADAIYLRGGSTEKLLNTLRKYTDLNTALAHKSKTVAGSSAGAYALSTLYSSHYEDIAEEGLAIVPVRVITHYESEKTPPKKGAVEALKNTANELPLIILREAEWSIINI